MKFVLRFLLANVLVATTLTTWAGPAEDANAVLEAWSAAYSSNEPEEVVAKYWPDAILLGTVSPVMSDGLQAISTYFGRLKGSGNKNAILERRVIVLGDSAVVMTGFYVFTRMLEGKPVPGPSRFTMLMTKHGDEWKIAHHHSSPLAQAP